MYFLGDKLILQMKTILGSLSRIYMILIFTLNTAGCSRSQNNNAAISDTPENAKLAAKMSAGYSDIEVSVIGVSCSGGTEFTSQKPNSLTIWRFDPV